MQAQIQSWPRAPRISVVLRGSDGAAGLRASIESVSRQVYPNWELIVVEDATRDFLDSRIRFVAKDAPIQAAIASAMGAFVCFVDPGDEMAEHALFRLAAALVDNPSLDVIYSDEDTVSDTGEHAEPFFKPDWSPEYFLAWNYAGRLAAYRRELIGKIGGIREEFADAFEYDLILRLIAGNAAIHHIPDVLYHRRKSAISPSPGTPGEGSKPAPAERALQDYLAATGQSATVHSGGGAPGVHRVRFALAGNPLVSIVIPSASRPATIRGRQSWYVLECVSTIRRLSTYKNVEIIVLDNNDMPADLAAALGPLEIRRIPFIGEFNLTRKINLGASQARGEQLILLNDDIEVITPDWIEAMLQFAQQPPIGAVGAQLLFPDDTQQHTGVILLNGNPRHPFYGQPAAHPGYFHSSQVHRNWSAVTGACMMTRTQNYKAVGGFSEQFGLNYNDIDYCLKLLAIGKRIVYTPYAKLYHYESVSKTGTYRREFEAFHRTWRQRFPRDPYYNPNLGRHFRVKP
ncbi:MAG: glycosyltransferase [Tepidisphaeraceae bacterium]